MARVGGIGALMKQVFGSGIDGADARNIAGSLFPADGGTMPY